MAKKRDVTKNASLRGYESAKGIGKRRERVLQQRREEEVR